MKREIEQQKREMLEKIEKVKQGKLDPSEILQSLSVQQKERDPNNVSRSPAKPVKTQAHEEKKMSDRNNSSSLPKESKNTTLDQTSKMQGNTSAPSTMLKKRNEEELKRELEALINKQNSEMLRVLEEEQNFENEREKHFIASTMDEKKRLEKQYGMERAKAQTRIQKLSEYRLY